MIRSMTGFGRCQKEINGMIITVELKSVNHRYFEFYCRVPRQYGFIDDKIKSYVNSRVSRGKVECLVTIEALNSETTNVSINKSLAKGYVSALEELHTEFGLREDYGASTIARFPDVLVVTKSEEDEEMIWNSVKEVAEKAVDSFVSMREIEGAKLKEDVKSRGKFIIDTVAYIEKRSPETVKEYNEKLVLRMQELLGDTTVDEQRLLTEAAIYADKIAVAEETVRLRSHIDQLNNFLESDSAIGRKMDFLIQEINREANTIGSKANDVDIARKVVDIKAEVEKIREQIQNIE